MELARSMHFLRANDGSAIILDPHSSSSWTKSREKEVTTSRVITLITLARRQNVVAALHVRHGLCLGLGVERRCMSAFSS